MRLPGALIENAVEKEDYREAAKIRDEISKRE
jgi:protein-arginine kinase activator protein McsA